MRKVLTLLLCFWLSGCYTLDNLRTDNRRNITKLAIGMTKQDVLDIMGGSYAEEGTLRVNNPYSAEILWGKDKSLDVYYYYTDLKRADATIASIELTPLIFENGTLIGWGWDFMHENIKKYKLDTRYPQE